VDDKLQGLNLLWVRKHWKKGLVISDGVAATQAILG
jgi:hypothetical protein